MKFCTKCGKEIREGAIFCENCGTPVAAQEKPPVCPNCGAEIREEAKFCSRCGAPVSGGTRPDAQANWDNSVRTTADNSSLATASLITGIIGLFCCGLILGIVAIVLAARSQDENGGILPPYAKIGRICGIIALVLRAVLLVVYVAAAAIGLFGLSLLF